MKRVYHTIDPDFRLRIAEVNAGFAPDLIGKTRQGQISNCALPLKLHILAWADDFPAKVGPKGDRVPSGFTSAVRDMFKRIVWGQRMNKGYVAFSHEVLGASTSLGKQPHTPTDYDPRTVRRAVAWLHKSGLIQVKTGGGWNRDDRRQLTSQYTPNFWVFLDPILGGFVRPPYFSEGYPWREKAEKFRRRIQKNVPAVVNDSAGYSGKKQDSDSRDKMSMLSEAPKPEPKPKSMDKMSDYNVNDGDATAAPPSPEGSTGSANAPTGIKRELFGQISKIANHLNLEVWELLASGGESGLIGESFAGMVRDYIFTGGSVVQSPLRYDPPRDVHSFGFIRVTEGDPTYHEIGGVKLEQMDGDSWLLIEYRTTQEFEAGRKKSFKKLQAAKVKAERDGE